MRREMFAVKYSALSAVDYVHGVRRLFFLFLLTLVLFRTVLV